MPDPFIKLKDNHFKFESHGVTISVRRLPIPGHVAFHVAFSSQRKPITIARATGTDNVKFWTALPDGQNREKEAAGVGKLIEEYIQSLA
jgi:hypothetical protein